MTHLRRRGRGRGREGGDWEGEREGGGEGGREGRLGGREGGREGKRGREGEEEIFLWLEVIHEICETHDIVHKCICTCRQSWSWMFHTRSSKSREKLTTYMYMDKEVYQSLLQFHNLKPIKL